MNGANHSSVTAVLFYVTLGNPQWKFLTPLRKINVNFAIVQNPLQTFFFAYIQYALLITGKAY